MKTKKNKFNQVTLTGYVKTALNMMMKKSLEISITQIENLEVQLIGVVTIDWKRSSNISQFKSL